MNGLEKLAGCMEIQRMINKDEPDEVDSLKLVDQDGVECLFSPEDCGPEQEEHESGVDWDSRSEDEDR